MPIVPITRRHVGDHGRGGLDAAGAGALERDLADRVALQHHGVERALDRRERVVAVDERRADADVDVAVDEPRRADEADHHLELARRGDVERVDPVDADGLDVGELVARVERDRGEDRHLRGRVRARDVVGRVGLGVALLLRVRERLVVGLARLHLGEHVVGRAVDDPEHAVDVRDDERLAQHLDHRDRRADARLEAQLHAGARGGREELGPAPRDELLVRGDDVLAAPQQLEHVLAGRLDAAHDLGDDRDPRVVEHVARCRS